MGEEKDVQDVEKKNFSGIPEARFVEDVDAFMKEPDNAENVEAVLRRLDEQHQKYKFMDANLTMKKRKLKTQIPDIQNCLEILTELKSKKEADKTISSQFLLSDQVYMKAQIPPTQKVYLWLGANTMLEYTLDGAETLLSKNLSTATKNLNKIEHDLDFLRDQCTTTEVNMARVYNWDVKRRQAAKDTKPNPLA